MKQRKDQEFITSNYLNNLKDSRRRRKSFITICSALALIVASVTVMEMIQPAAAVTNTESVLDCDFEVHEHTDECYRILYDEEGNETGKELICGQADFVAHQHTEECYKTVFNEETGSEEQILVCELPEIEPHVHVDSCYEEKQVLVCEEDHEHDESCYETERVLICDRIELHTHTDDCYEIIYDEAGNEVDKKLICGQLEVLVHQHDDSCFKEITVDDGTEEVPAGEETQEEVIPSEPAPETAEADATETLIALDDTYRITVTYGKDAQIPENASLKVTEITKGFTKYEEYYAQVEEMLDSITEIQSIRIFDISIMAGDDPEELTPVEPNAPVDVRISYPNGLQMSDDDRIRIVHFTDPEPEVLASETVEKNETLTDVLFTTESFSDFAAVQERITTNMSNGAIAYLSFDKDGDGYSGAGARANKVNANKPKVVGEGHSGGAVYLDGNTYLTLTKDDGSSLLTGLDEFTVSYWVKTTESTSDGQHDNWAYFAAPNANEVQWLNEHYIATGHNGSTITSQRFNNNGSRPQSASASNATPVNQWHHVAVVYTNNNTQIYVDGVMVGQEGSNVDLSNMLGNNSVFQIGRANWGSGEGFRGYLDEFSVFNYALNDVEINLLKNSTNGAIALNPMNENGVLPGTLPNSRNVTSTHYKDMTIDGHVVNPSNDTPSYQRNDLQYSRIYVPVTYGSDGKATITLPSNSQLGNFTVSDDDTSHSIIQSDDKYQWELKGWINIATDEYYDTRNGPVKVTVDSSQLNVFYADWEAANYNYTLDNPIDTVSTSDFVTIKMFDYNEIHNIDGRISLAYQVDGDTSQFIPRSTIESEEWYIHQTEQGQGDWLQFVDNTDGSNSWQYGTIGNTQGREGGNYWNNYSGSNPVEGIVGPWGQKPTTHVIGEMFDESNTPGTGIHYLGQSDYLFSYDPATKMYSYDSDTNGAVYNQEDQRFYVADSAKTIDCFNWDDRPGFVPFNDFDDPLAYNNGSVNYWFGMSIDLQFWLPDTPGTEHANQIAGENMIFNFRGDDDVWVLIDGKLALDIGGIHEELDGLIDFSTGEITVSYYPPWAPGEQQVRKRYNLSRMGIGAGNHTLSFYYMERGGNASNCEITFNLVPRWIQTPANIKTAKVTKTWSQDTPEDEKNSVVFSLLSDGQPVTDSSVTYLDGTYDETTGEWSYVWEYLEGGHTYEVVEQTDSDFDVTKTSGLGNYAYWAISGYNDEDAYDGNPILLGNGNNDRGYLLGGNGQSVNADIIHDVIHFENVTEDVQWTVEDFDTQSLHFYLKNNQGQYLSIVEDNSIKLVNPEDVSLDKKNISYFYVGPTGDLNDANSRNRLMIDSNHVITVGEKYDASYAGVESPDRIRVYALQSFEKNTFEYTMVNTYVRFPIQFRKVSIADLTKGLEGAGFSLYRSPEEDEQLFDASTLLTTLTSGDDGYLLADSTSEVNDAYVVTEENKKILSVHPGTYYLKEDTCPEGYLKYADYFAFKVDEEGVLSFVYPESMAGSPQYITTVQETIAEEQVDVQTGLLPNDTGAELPYTGGSGTYPYTIFGGILLLGAGILLRQKKRMMAD